MSNDDKNDVKEIMEKINSLKEETVENIHKISVLRRVLFDLQNDIPFKEKEYMIKTPKYKI